MRLIRRHRWAAFSIAWAYLVGYLLAFAHFVEERHAPCPEHGAQHHIAESTELVLLPRSTTPPSPVLRDDLIAVLLDDTSVSPASAGFDLVTQSSPRVGRYFWAGALAVAGVHDGPRLHQGADVADDHCDFLQFFRTSTFTVDARPTSTPASLAEERPDSLAHTSWRPADNARWRYAPKQSPPILT